MAKTILLGYIIAITVFALWPTWLTIATLLAGDNTTWRHWAEAVRVIGTGWLFFVIPALVVYFLIIQLPQAISNRLNAKEIARQQAQLQAKARALNPKRETEAEPATAAIAATTTAACTANATTATPCTERRNAEQPATADPVREIARSGTETPLPDTAKGNPSFLARLLRPLVCRSPIRSSIRWRLLMSVLGWPALACLSFVLGEAAHEISGSPAPDFGTELMAILLLSLYLTALPIAGYWICFELVLRNRPQWLTSPLRHYAAALLGGTLLAWGALQLDPQLQGIPLAGIEAVPYDLHILAAGAGIGMLLALLYRLPVRLEHYFQQDPLE